MEIYRYKFLKCILLMHFCDARLIVLCQSMFLSFFDAQDFKNPLLATLNGINWNKDMNFYAFIVRVLCIHFYFNVHCIYHHLLLF